MITQKGKTVFSIIGTMLALLTIAYIIIKMCLWGQLSPNASVEQGADILGGFNYLFYFTTISNLMVAFWLLMWSYNNFFKTDKFKIVNNVYVQASITCYILVTMFVYWIFGVSLLGTTIMENFLYIVINFHLHLIVPIFFIVLWFFPTSRQELDYNQAIKVLIYPLIYFFVVELKGNLDGWYPYGFLDTRRLWSYVFKQEFSNIGAIFLLAGACLAMSGLIYAFALLIFKIRNKKSRCSG